MMPSFFTVSEKSITWILWCNKQALYLAAPKAITTSIINRVILENALLQLTPFVGIRHCAIDLLVTVLEQTPFSLEIRANYANQKKPKIPDFHLPLLNTQL